MHDEYFEMLDEPEGSDDLRDAYKKYHEWVVKQTPLIRGKLAVMLTELHRVPGADDAKPKNEMEQMAAAMRQGTEAQAAAMQHAASARERSTKEKVAARSKDKEAERTARKEESDLERDERREIRAADDAKNERFYGAITSALTALAPALRPQTAAPPPPSTAAGSTAAGSTAAGSTAAGSTAAGSTVTRFTTVAELLESIHQFTPEMRTALLAKFDEQFVDLADIVDSFKLGGMAAANETLKDIAPQAGVRTKIIKALMLE